MSDKVKLGGVIKIPKRRIEQVVQRNSMIEMNAKWKEANEKILNLKEGLMRNIGVAQQTSNRERLIRNKGAILKRVDMLNKERQKKALFYRAMLKKRNEN